MTHADRGFRPRTIVPLEHEAAFCVFGGRIYKRKGGEFFLHPNGAYEFLAHGQVSNEVVLWDRIIQRKEDARVNIKGGKNKYIFRDFNKTFRCVGSKGALFGSDGVAGTRVRWSLVCGTM